MPGFFAPPTILYILLAATYFGKAMEILLSVTVFVVFAAVFVFLNLVLGSLARPRMPNAEKAAVYECGEPTIGSSWVQFDLRFYIVALVFLVFDVEVALFYPWAVAYGNAGELSRKFQMSIAEFRAVAIVDMFFFFGVLLVGFAYLWRFGYLDWVRSAATTSISRTLPGSAVSSDLAVSRRPVIDLSPAVSATKR